MRAKSNSEHRRDGTFKPSRHARRVELTSDGPPKIPSGLSADGRRLWRLVLDRLPKEAIDKLDGPTLEGACRWYSEMLDSLKRLREETDPSKRYAATILAATCSRQFAAFAAKLGMSPVDRLKLQNKQEAPPEQNPLEALRLIVARPQTDIGAENEAV